MDRLRNYDGEALHAGLLKILAISYFFAGTLHVLDLFDVRLKFSEMDFIWQSWTIFLAFADLLVAASLWSKSRLGELTFVAVVLSQIAVYLGWADHFGNQYAWIAFHLVTLTVYLVVLTYASPGEMLPNDRDYE